MDVAALHTPPMGVFCRTIPITAHVDGRKAEYPRFGGSARPCAVSATITARTVPELPPFFPVSTKERRGADVLNKSVARVCQCANNGVCVEHGGGVRSLWTIVDSGRRLLRCLRWHTTVVVVVIAVRSVAYTVCQCSVNVTVHVFHVSDQTTAISVAWHNARELGAPIHTNGERHPQIVLPYTAAAVVVSVVSVIVNRSSYLALYAQHAQRWLAGCNKYVQTPPLFVYAAERGRRPW